MRLLYAEVLKIRTAPRTALALVLGLAAIVALGSASAASTSDATGFASETIARDILDVVSTAVFFSLILGILIVTWEYRHGTVTPTFLITPRRERVLASKLAIAAVVAVTLTLFAVVLALALAAIWVDLDLGSDHWEVIGRIAFAAIAWAVLGVGLGATLQSQVGAIVLAFVWFLIAEPVIGAAIDALGDAAVSDFFPGSALERLIATEVVAPEEFGGVEDRPYGLWGAAALVAAYAAAAAALGAFMADRRDVG